VGAQKRANARALRAASRRCDVAIGTSRGSASGPSGNCAGVIVDGLRVALAAIAVVPSVRLGAVVCLSGLAILATLVPARHAARMPIPDALGHV
jgi:ABC-type lipoprotein release transport system permease subunit